jgi:hypothetical protein
MWRDSIARDLARGAIIHIGPRSNILISSDFDIKSEAIGAKALYGAD